MALSTDCRRGSGETLSEEVTTTEDSEAPGSQAPPPTGSNSEPMSDSCGESDMEGLDLSLFEPQGDGNLWCDSRIHAGTLYILVHNCGKKDISIRRHFLN